MKLKLFMLLFFVLITTHAHAQEKSRWSLGVGPQYALAGVKYAIYSHDTRIFLSGGVGLAAGVELPLMLNRKMGIDVNVGAAPFLIHYSTHVNYHFSGYANRGWVFGIGGGEYLYGVSPVARKLITLSFAYKL